MQNDETFEVTVRDFLMSTDTMARFEALTVKQFNGLYGCIYCFHPGNVSNDTNTVYLFLKTSIPINEASKNLEEFLKEFQSLYVDDNMMYNVHLLEHLAKCVKDCGPL